MDIVLSDRIQRIKPSPTLTIGAKASEMKAKGQDIISLSLGEPDFDTPDHIKQAAKKALDQGFTKYTAIEGIPELRQAVADKFHRENHLEYTPKQILISNGAKQSFYNLAQVLLKAGDEVIIPAPYWVSYPDMVLLADAKPVSVFASQEQHFKITPEQLEKAITPKTRLLVLNSPCNPTGMAYSKEEWKKLGEVLEKHPEIYIVSDDIYEHIYWKEEPFSNLLMCCPNLYDRTILLHGVSKTYAMTGFRIGFAAGPQAIIEAMTVLQSQSTSSICSISQKAAVAALTGDQSCIKTMVKAFKERHDYLVEALNRLPGVTCLPNDGTFYAFPYMQGLIERIRKDLPKKPGKLVDFVEKGLGSFPEIQDDVHLADFLLTEAKVALVPGSAFGAPGYLRFSFATSLDKIKEAIKRIAQCCE